MTYMKRFSLILFICAALLFSFTGCNAQNTDEDLIPTPAPEIPAEDDGLPVADEAFEEPAPEPCTFTVYRYAVSSNAKVYLGDAQNEYNLLIDAVCAGDEMAVLSDYDSAVKVAEVFSESPYSAFAVLELWDDGTIQITYTENGDADTFDSAAKAIVEGTVYTESNELETAVGLYGAVCSGFTFEESEENSLYRIIVEKKGGTKEFAEALNYLFNQNGIPSMLAFGTAADSEHFWVIAELDGVLYHFDPTFENSATGGLGLSYFGMSDAARTSSGCALPCTTGHGAYAETSGEICPDTHFDGLFTDVTDWKCDVRDHFLYLAYGFESDYLTSVQTSTGAAAAG